MLHAIVMVMKTNNTQGFYNIQSIHIIQVWLKPIHFFTHDFKLVTGSTEKKKKKRILAHSCPGQCMRCFCDLMFYTGILFVWFQAEEKHFSSKQRLRSEEQRHGTLQSKIIRLDFAIIWIDQFRCFSVVFWRGGGGGFASGKSLMRLD